MGESGQIYARINANNSKNSISSFLVNLEYGSKIWLYVWDQPASVFSDNSMFYGMFMYNMTLPFAPIPIGGETHDNLIGRNATLAADREAQSLNVDVQMKRVIKRLQATKGKCCCFSRFCLSYYSECAYFFIYFGPYEEPKNVQH